MRNNPLKFIFALSLLLNLSLVGTAGYVYYTKKMYLTSPIDYRFQITTSYEPSLSAEQFRIMKGKLASFQALIDQKRREIIKERVALLRLLRSETPDMKAIEAAISQLSNMQEDIEKTVVMHILEGKDFLDKNQQQRFLDRLEEAMMSKKHSVYEQEYPTF